MNNTISQLLDELLHIIYPNICVSCKEESASSNDVFCIFCKSDLPYSNAFDIRNNFLEQKLIGRLEFETGAYLFHFYKESKIQEAMHEFKYNGIRNIGVVLGRQFGEKWKNSTSLSMPDVIIPVPLHYQRQAKRGYNQSKVFAEGINETLGVPVLEKVLLKRYRTQSQTKKSRLDRIDNIKESFCIKQPTLLEDKHILLVDDVLTTGATIECCAAVISAEVQCKISIGTIALAQN